jgi:hypothetical protein
MRRELRCNDGGASFYTSSSSGARYPSDAGLNRKNSYRVVISFINFSDVGDLTRENFISNLTCVSYPVVVLFLSPVVISL